jgi:hypothetical protein
VITKTAKSGLGLAVVLLLLGTGGLSRAVFAGGKIKACPTVIPSTANGTWTVANTLTAKGTCITVKATGVTIDLSGFTITGPRTGTNYGIIDDGSCKPKCQQNIVIANGTIQGFRDGIHLNSTEYAGISQVTSQQNSNAGIWVVQNFAVAISTQASNNTNYGMYFEGSSNTIYESSASNNEISGIVFTKGDNVIQGTQADSNGSDGISFAGADNTVAGSDASQNGDHGMYFARGGNTVIGSFAEENKVDGGFLIKGAGNHLVSNEAFGNGKFGISVVCPSNLVRNSAQKIVTSRTGCARFGNQPPP